MIDNFERIKRLFYFNDANKMFFHCQIMQKGRGPDLKRVREQVVKTYFIMSRKHLDVLKDEIILLCNHYKARAYIDVAGKDFSTLQSLVLVKLANNIHQSIVENPGEYLKNAVNELKPRMPRWVAEVKDVSMINSVKKKLSELYAGDWGDVSAEVLRQIEDNYIYAEIPTNQGVHLIIRPFNDTETFGEAFPDVDIIKNPIGTLLYYPDFTPKYRCSQCGSTNI